METSICVLTMCTSFAIVMGNFFFFIDVGGNPQQCYQQLLVDIREILKNRNLRCVIRVLFFNNKFSTVGMTFLK